MGNQILIGLWIAATMGHFVHTAAAAARLLPTERTVDERVFHAVLFGVGTLLFVLHAVALAVGLSPVTALLALGLWHAALAGIAGTWRTADATAAVTPTRLTAAESAAVAVTFGLLGSWVVFAAGSAVVTGTDAAHYHVPNAVNLALGTSPFDLPATQHLYPIAGSVAAAWFILPTGNPLLVDLSMCLPFLLLGAAVNTVFRLSTGVSGLAWSSWMVLLLFSMPLFRVSSLVSADLWFAAGFMGLVAALMAPWTRRAWPWHDVLLAALAVGVLVGSKATGAVASGLLLTMCLGASLVRRPVAPGGTRLVPALAVAAGAGALALGAGGIWLVRNWLLFGSPLAPSGVSVLGLTLFPGEPLAPTTYLSILGDLRETPSYSLASRTAHYARLWLDRWYLPLLPLALLVPLDLIAGRRRAGDPVRASRMFLLAAAVAGGVLAAMLVGAPWTSLEWTRGLALRYALPVLVLGPLVALVGAFPTRWRWFASRDVRDAVALVVVLSCSLLFYVRLDPSQPRTAPVPDLALSWLAAGGAAVAAGAWWRRRSSRLRVVIGVLVILGAALAWAPGLARRGEQAVGTAAATETRERAALAAGSLPLSEAREVHLRALEDPRRPEDCHARRVYALGRLDEPLMLQDPTFRTVVFYAGWDVDLTRTYGPLGACEYILTTHALQDTDKGAALVRVLSSDRGTREVARTDLFLLLGAR